MPSITPQKTTDAEPAPVRNASQFGFFHNARPPEALLNNLRNNPLDLNSYSEPQEQAISNRERPEDALLNYLRDNPLNLSASENSDSEEAISNRERPEDPLLNYLNENPVEPNLEEDLSNDAQYPLSFSSIFDAAASYSSNDSEERNVNNDVISDQSYIR